MGELDRLVCVQVQPVHLDLVVKPPVQDELPAVGGEGGDEKVERIEEIRAMGDLGEHPSSVRICERARLKLQGLVHERLLCGCAVDENYH